MFIKKICRTICMITIIALSSSLYASVHVSAENNKDILLSSADQMILHSIEQMNAKIDKMNSDITCISLVVVQVFVFFKNG
ncbi:MAG: hypothetical protein U9N77_03925 [Thermodesulfobacteriota bacterium]|nr:hypothetical protein [Thermodesulfobacteriota bacterium]